MPSLTEHEALGLFPITRAELVHWKASGAIAAVMDPHRGELFDQVQLETLVSERRVAEREAIEREVATRLNTSNVTSHWEKLSTLFTGLGSLAALIAIFVAGVQFNRTRQALLADNEYRVWTDVLEAAEHAKEGKDPSNWAGINDRVMSAKVMLDAKNLSQPTWKRIVTAACPDDQTMDLLTGADDLKKICGEASR
jgi:hypothetical protein